MTKNHIHYKWDNLEIKPIVANELKKGDCIISSNIQLKEDNEIPKNELIIFALLIADGYYGYCKNNYKLVFTNNEPLLIRLYKNAMYELYGVNTLDYLKGESSYGIQINNKSIRLDMLSKGLDFALSDEKKIPDKIMYSTKENKSLFLNLLFSCDGCVEKTNNMTYCSKSYKLINQILVLLNQFDIYATVRTKKVNGEIYYELFISASYSLIFRDKIGLSKKHKHDRLQGLSNIKKGNDSFNLIYLNNWVLEYFKELFRKEKKTHIVKHFHATLHNGGWIQKDTIRLYLTKLLPKYLFDATFMDIYGKIMKHLNLNFMKIKEITHEISTEETYDIDVSDNHNFYVGLSNFYLTHNSSATILLAKEYVHKYSFICPHCKNEFYKNVYSVKRGDNGKPIFYIHDAVKQDKVWIQCPEEYELDMASNQKVKVSGCGHKFRYSQRKRIKWDAAKLIAYDNQDVIEKIHTLPSFSPLIADECVRFAASFEANRTDSKELKKLFTVIRPKRFWIFFNIPDVLWIETKYREAMSSFWLRMIERGQGILFEKDKSESEDKYHIKELQKLMGTIKYFTPIDKIKRNLQKHPCYFDTFQFPELDAQLYDNYELVRNAVNLKRKVEEKAYSNKDLAKIASYNLMNNWDRIYSNVAKSKELRMTYPTLINEVFADPMERKRLVSEPTVRDWIKGIDNFLETKGQKAEVFNDADLKVEKEFDDIAVEL